VAPGSLRVHTPACARFGWRSGRGISRSRWQGCCPRITAVVIRPACFRERRSRGRVAVGALNRAFLDTLIHGGRLMETSLSTLFVHEKSRCQAPCVLVSARLIEAYGVCNAISRSGVVGDPDANGATLLITWKAHKDAGLSNIRKFSVYVLALQHAMTYTAENANFSYRVWLTARECESSSNCAVARRPKRYSITNVCSIHEHRRPMFHRYAGLYA